MGVLELVGGCMALDWNWGFEGGASLKSQPCA